MTISEAGLLASVTLIASVLGGILFGLLADRIGRRAALRASIIVYSVFTAACGFSRGVWELAALRLGVGLGMAGEWATAALVSETWSAQHRGKALGLMQSGFAIGYALAAVRAGLLRMRAPTSFSPACINPAVTGFRAREGPGLLPQCGTEPSLAV